MQRSLFFLILLTASLAAQAQPALDGRWAFHLRMPDGHGEMHLTLTGKTVQDTLRLNIASDQGDLPLDNVSFRDDVLRFDMPTDHATILCTLYKQEEENFTGVCKGPIGESPTTLKRRPEHADQD